MKKGKTLKKWSRRDEKYLREHYADERTADIAVKLGRTANAVGQHARDLGIRKSASFMSACGLNACKSPKSVASRFKSGHTPHNKGRKHWQYMSREGVEQCRMTQFKPGLIPHNAHPVGYERINSNGYVLVKVSGKKRMVLKHRYVWEQHHGRIPSGMCILFRDGDKTNCDIDNLYMLSFSDCARNACNNESPEHRAARIRKAQAKRNESIRKDKMRIRWGLEPKTKIVKRWYEPERKQCVV